QPVGAHRGLGGDIPAVRWRPMTRLPPDRLQALPGQRRGQSLACPSDHAFGLACQGNKRSPTIRTRANSTTPTTATVTMAAKTIVVLLSDAAESISAPSPFCAPTHSAMTAPMTLNVTPICMPASTKGTDAGIRTIQKTLISLAP